MAQIISEIETKVRNYDIEPRHVRMELMSYVASIAPGHLAHSRTRSILDTLNNSDANISTYVCQSAGDFERKLHTYFRPVYQWFFCILHMRYWLGARRKR
ncbi:hypothetical protein DPMN_024162 [Dreissena polymorpha]|uniref:Uncharacterized protein n=1 Tax=Dreissena polymorpha TaxID=45954 RepID=A0A9D4LNE0_DREPO|nr:hypothetical protein DPMN_024162 [Dreissena polymorpha]